MAISDDLFKAILAMDAYNRGPNAGLNVDGVQIGNAFLRDDLLPAGSQAASFFAQSYTWNGETIISYRGTDILPGGTNPFLSASSWLDVGQWAELLAGNYDATQLRLAADFYQQIKANVSGSIETTGHSLGGALAGFVAALYGLNTELFDNIWFTQAVRNLYTAVTTGAPIVSEGQVQYIVDTEAKNFFFGGQTPTAPFSFPTGQFAGYTVPGEVAGQYARTSEEQALLQSVALQNTGLGNVALHSQALLVISLFAQEQITSPSWIAFTAPLFQALFRDPIAQALHFQKGVTGNSEAWSQMQTAIAYSAIDEGVKPYGDKGIRALFNDAGDVGRALDPTLGLVAQYLQDGKVQKAIADIIVEYAGLLAKNQEIESSKSSAITGFEKGVLYYDGVSRLIGDFSRPLWMVNGVGVDIVGKKNSDRCDLGFRIAGFVVVNQGSCRQQMGRRYQRHRKDDRGDDGHRNDTRRRERYRHCSRSRTPRQTMALW